MDIHIPGWIGLAAITLTLIVIDTIGHMRTPHEPTMRETAVWSVAYIGMVLAFGDIIWFVWGEDFAQGYLVGYITEKTLSIDNLFVSVIMISSLEVPRKYQQEVPFTGIVIVLILRLIFILTGTALIENFSRVFYSFGAWLLWTTFSRVREGVQGPDDDDEEYRPSDLVKLVARAIPMTDGFMGDKTVHRHAGHTMITPMMLCTIIIDIADVIFAVDSIPVIYSLTSEPSLVFSVNAFSLLGLCQLYFLVDGLSDRLVYLHCGLAAVLDFTGFKFIAHTLHTNEVPSTNGGQEWHTIPETSIGVSPSVIITTVLATVVASVLKSRTDVRRVKAAP